MDGTPSMLADDDAAKALAVALITLSRTSRHWCGR
jgi:hypothetical protein